MSIRGLGGGGPQSKVVNEGSEVEVDTLGRGLGSGSRSYGSESNPCSDAGKVADIFCCQKKLKRSFQKER